MKIHKFKRTPYTKDTCLDCGRGRSAHDADNLETSLEKWACGRFREAGMDPVKRGQDGEPDRELFVGNGLHCWVEFKKEGEDLRPSQKVWLKHKKPKGDKFYLVDTKEKVQDVVREMAWIFGSMQ